MRVTSALFVAALVRRVFGAGGFAAIERRGAAEAGAIFIRARRRDGLETLYGPAPQSAFGADAVSERLFEKRLDGTAGEEVAALIERERRFDSDLWLIEIECDEPDEYVTLADAESR